MPTITDTPTTVFIFCPSGSCAGYRTEEVDGIAREIARSAFEEAGPQAPNGSAIATSFIKHFVPSGETDEHGYAIAAELTCPYCNRERQVSGSPRPVYQNVSNQSQRRLLDMQEAQGLL